jgi:predicted ATP-grasp superfamily ATP-dependent carboligase
MMRKVLVLGSVSRTILAVIRSLGRGGVGVHLAWNDPDCVSLRSRYLHRSHKLPPYSETDPAWLEALAGLMRRERFDLVLPCSDVDTLACHRHRAELGPHGRVYTPNAAACEVLFDKLKTNELARSVDVCLPREIVATTPEQARQAVAEFGFPLVLKPRRTFDPAHPCAGDSPRVRKAYGQDDLDRLLPATLAGGPVAVQENFIGRGAGVELLLHDGEPLLVFQHLRVHEPLHGGQSSYRQSVAVSPDLLAAALRLLRAVRYNGVAMVEFKVNPATGAWVFIEVNARFWGSLPLALAAGADFPLALVQFLLDGRVCFPRRYRKGIYCRNLSLDLEWQAANLLADRSDPTLATLPLSRVLGETCAHVLTLREHSDTWTPDDPGPGIAELCQLARRVCGRLARVWRRRKLSILQPVASKS